MITSRVKQHLVRLSVGHRLETREKSCAERINEIQGRSRNEKADMLMSQAAEAVRQQGDLSPGAAMEGQRSP